MRAGRLAARPEAGGGAKSSTRTSRISFASCAGMRLDRRQLLLEACRIVDIGNRAEFYHALSSCLVKHPEDRLVFDQLQHFLAQPAAHGKNARPSAAVADPRDGNRRG